MVRIVMAESGPNGDDRSATMVATALRNAGHEVVYTGLHQSAEQVVETAIQEDADLVGVSVLTGAPLSVLRAVVGLLEERDAADIVVFCGAVPGEDLRLHHGIDGVRVFAPGATAGEVTGWVGERFPS